MTRRLLCAATALFLTCAASNAYTAASGTLSISGQLEGSVVLVLYTNAHGATLTGSGSPAASITFGTVSKYGTPAVPVGGTNIVKSDQSDGFALTTMVDVEVDKANLGSRVQPVSATATER